MIRVWQNQYNPASSRVKCVNLSYLYCHRFMQTIVTAGVGVPQATASVCFSIPRAKVQPLQGHSHSSEQHSAPQHRPGCNMVESYLSTPHWHLPYGNRNVLPKVWTHTQRGKFLFLCSSDDLTRSRQNLPQSEHSLGLRLLSCSRAPCTPHQHHLSPSHHRTQFPTGCRETPRLSQHSHLSHSPAGPQAALEWRKIEAPAEDKYSMRFLYL